MVLDCHTNVITPAKEIWERIADAWEPYLGRPLAEERARDAATALMAHDLIDAERVSDTLTRCFLRATQPMYGQRRMSGSLVVDAVVAAVHALGLPDSADSGDLV